MSEQAPFVLVSEGPDQTRALAAALGRVCRGGEVIGLAGALGAGKTVFAQGLAAGLGVPQEAYVCSPTFVLIHEHQGRIPLYHVDLYRLDDPDEAVFIGYEDLFDRHAVVAIEWFDRFPELWPPSYVLVTFDEVGVVRRQFRIEARGKPAHDVLRRWQEEVGGS